MTNVEKKEGPAKRSVPDKKVAPQSDVVSRYFRETRGELRKVTWPTREESQRLTAVVLGVTLAMAAFLWMFDFIFLHGLEKIILWIVGL